MTKIILLLIIFLTFSCKENKNVDKVKLESQSEISKLEATQTDQKVQSKPDPLIEKAKVKKTQKEYFLDDIKVLLIQYKSDGTEFFCKAEIIVSKDGNQLNYKKITLDPVGGSYGISKPTKFHNHLIFSRHGDYDGGTLVINNKGQIYNLIGGEHYLDTESKLLFTSYESDVGGCAVFDLKTNSTLLKMYDIEDRPWSFHKEFKDRYFMTCVNDNNDERSIWELELDRGTIKKVDLNDSEINSKNVLKKISNENEVVDCVCEK